MVAAYDPLFQPWMGLSLYVFPLILLLEDKARGGSGRGDKCLCSLFAAEVLVPTSPDDMQDPSSAPTQDGSPVATSVRHASLKGHAPHHQIEDP